MPTSSPLGPLVVCAGLAVVVIGLLIWSGGLSWFGHLPGDIRSEHGNVRFYFPIVSMLVVSVVLTVILRLFRR